MYEKGGLVYTALDDNGNKIGTPIKASAFYSKPTLKYLEQKFVQNEALKQAHQRKLRVDIQLALLREKQTLPDFKKALVAKGIDVIIKQNGQGIIYGITHIDFTSKCVFNGSDLGKEYSAKGILEQLAHQQRPQELKQSQEQINKVKPEHSALQQEYKNEGNRHQVNSQESFSALELLLKPKYSNNYVPKELLKKKKKQSRGLRW